VSWLHELVQGKHLQVGQGQILQKPTQKEKEQLKLHVRIPSKLATVIRFFCSAHKQNNDKKT
jgi:hypothetical protein